MGKHGHHYQGRKRKRPNGKVDAKEVSNASDGVGLAETLARLRGVDADSTHEQDNAGPVEPSPHNSKRPKKSHHDQHSDDQTEILAKDARPTLTVASLHRLEAIIKLGDVQKLLLYCLADGESPQWISVKHHGQVKKAVVLLVPGLEKGMFDGEIDLSTVSASVAGPDVQETDVSQAENTGLGKGCEPSQGKRKTPDDYLPIPLDSEKLSDPLKPLSCFFSHVWPVKAPGDDKYSKVHSPLHAMLNSPLPRSQEDKEEEKSRKGPRAPREGRNWENQPVPITALLATKEDLLENDYTLHPLFFDHPAEVSDERLRGMEEGNKEEASLLDSHVGTLEHFHSSSTIDSHDRDPVSGKTVLAMDCEMCKVAGDCLALTRISIVGWDGAIVMDELVRPDKPITDYLTPYSGITAAKLDPVSTTLADIQSRLLGILTPQTIVIGHSLNSDFTALMMTHPYIVDTSIIYQHPRGPPLKSSLKWLAQKYLNREIQKGHGTQGHDSIEDAQACLDLVKMKCEKGGKWGTFEASGESIFKRLSRTPRSRPSANSTGGKIGAIIDHSTPERSFGAMAQHCIGCRNDEEVVLGVRRAVLGDHDGSVIPGDGVDFTWARLRDLEAFRGWSNDNRQTLDKTRPDTSSAPSLAALSTTVNSTVQHIVNIHALLPPCTLFIVYSGTGDPLEMGRLQDMQRRFKKEYATKRWDQLSVKWTDEEEQALRKACGKARVGIGMVCMT